MEAQHRRGGWNLERPQRGIGFRPRRGADVEAGARALPRRIGGRGPAERAQRGEMELDRRQRARSRVMSVERRTPALVRIPDAHASAASPDPERGARIAEEIDRQIRREGAQPPDQLQRISRPRLAAHRDQLIDAGIAFEQRRRFALGHISDARRRAHRPHLIERGKRETDVAEEARPDQQHAAHGGGIDRAFG